MLDRDLAKPQRQPRELASLCRYGSSLLMIALSCSIEAANRPTVTMLLPERVQRPGEQLADSGRTKQLIAVLAKESGLDIQTAFYPWRRAQKLAERGEGLLWGVVRTPERARVLSFSTPMFTTPVWIIVPEGKRFAYHGIQDLQGKTVSITRGSQYGGEFMAQRDKLFKVEEEAGTLRARLGMLAQGRVDLLLSASTQQTSKDYAQHLNFRWGDLGRWEVLSTPFSVDAIHIAAARDKPISQHLPALSGAIQRLQQRGVIQEIVARHAQPATRPATPADVRPGAY